MKKHTIKSIIIILILVSLFTLFVPKNIYAGTAGGTTNPTFSITGIFESVKEFLTQGSTTPPGGGDVGGEIVDQVQPIINALYWIGVAVVIGASMFLGVQYFMASGDPKAKAELKSKLIGFLISAAVMLAAYPIWYALTGLLSSIVM